jgi:hypothetical protein
LILLTLQDLPPGYIITCDCGQIMVRDSEGNYECHQADCGLAW